MDHTKKPVKILLLSALAAVFLVSGGISLNRQLQYRKIASDSAEAARIAGISSKKKTPALSHPDFDPSSEEPENPLPEEITRLAEVDLAALQEVNEDVVGWIEIPDTELSYPLVQGKNNSYYLTRNWKREWSGPGSVYLESTNSRELTDFHTIAYAHRMNNDTMFGTLKYYKDQAFWEEHPSVYLVTDEGICRYDIFSAREASVKGLVFRLDLVSGSLEEDFLADCLGNSLISTGITPDSGDRILTLSTCTQWGHANRWVVHCRLAQVYGLDGD